MAKFYVDPDWNDDDDYYECSNCGSEMKLIGDVLVCKNCGRSMDEDDYVVEFEDEDTWYPTYEELMGLESEDDEDEETYDEVYGELSDD